MPKVSIIIPVYKSVNVLKKAVSSVWNQSFTDFEILLIDDGSPDDSIKLCYELQREDDRIRVFHKENGGICSARNYGLEKAQGKYIAFLDHDDEYDKQYLEDNVKLLEQYDADVVKFEGKRKSYYLDGHVRTERGKRISLLPGVKNGIVCYDCDQIKSNILNIRDASKILNVWDGIYSGALIRKHNIRFDESFKYGHEDILFSLMIFSYAKCAVFNAKAYYLHNYSESTSTSAVFSEQRVKDAVKTTRTEVELLHKWNYPEEQIVQSYMNGLFLILGILNLPSGQISYREKAKLLSYYRENTLMTIASPKQAIQNLFHQKRLSGILAWMLYHRKYGICGFLYKMYIKMLPQD